MSWKYYYLIETSFIQVLEFILPRIHSEDTRRSVRPVRNLSLSVSDQTVRSAPSFFRLLT